MIEIIAENLELPHKDCAIPIDWISNKEAWKRHQEYHRDPNKKFFSEADRLNVLFCISRQSLRLLEFGEEDAKRRL